MKSEGAEVFLFNELKAGNPRAFDCIFRDYYSLLCRYSYSLVRDKDNAQSLVQNAFVRLWENRFSLDHVTNLPAYLTSMVRSESLNWLRHEKHNLHLASLPPDLRSENPREGDIHASDFTGKLVISISTLPDRCREAFEMSRFDNLTAREIADRMGISVKGVEALITRALKSLRAELSEFLPSREGKEEKGCILFLLLRNFCKKAFS